jgi:hypothetical protein
MVYYKCALNFNCIYNQSDLYTAKLQVLTFLHTVKTNVYVSS